MLNKNTPRGPSAIPWLRPKEAHKVINEKGTVTEMTSWTGSFCSDLRAHPRNMALPLGLSFLICTMGLLELSLWPYRAVVKRREEIRPRGSVIPSEAEVRKGSGVRGLLGSLAMSEPQGMPAPPPAAKAPGSHQADEDLLLLAVPSAREAQATPSTLEEGWDKGHWASTSVQVAS